MTREALLALAKLVLAAQAKREESFDRVTQRYTLSCSAAAYEVADGEHAERASELVGLLNHYAWNDAQDWAQKEIALG